MDIKRHWPGVARCFLLYTAVCLCLTLNVKGAFLAGRHPELGLLFFIIPGAVASALTRSGEVVKPLLGATLAAPFCLLVMRLFTVSGRSFFQELAWLLSGVFWFALGALVVMFMRRALFHPRRKIKTPSK